MMRNAFSDLSVEETQLMILETLVAVLDKLPRTDSADRVTVAIETGSVGIATNQTLATITTVNTVASCTGVAGFGAVAAPRPADAVPMHVANAGAMHLYNNIIVG